MLVISGGMEHSSSVELKTKLKRIVAMLTRLALRAEDVSESPEPYDVDYEHEHRCAEQELDDRCPGASH